METVWNHVMCVSWHPYCVHIVQTKPVHWVAETRGLWLPAPMMVATVKSYFSPEMSSQISTFPPVTMRLLPQSPSLLHVTLNLWGVVSPAGGPHLRDTESVFTKRSSIGPGAGRSGNKHQLVQEQGDLGININCSIPSIWGQAKHTPLLNVST